MILATLLLAFVSLGINGVLIWFVLRAKKTLDYMSEEMLGLLERSSDFTARLELMNQSEVYHGDETIHTLLLQSREFLQEIELLKDIFSFKLLDQEYEKSDKDNI
jgi:hypothetical protein